MAARKKSRQAVRNRQGGFPGWGWAVIAFVVGAVLMAVVLRGNLLRSMSKDGPQANPQATAQRGSEPGVADTANADAAAKKPTYDFYSVLPEKDVRIPDAEISAMAKAEQAQTATTPAPGASVTNPDAAPMTAQQAAPAPDLVPTTAADAVRQDITAAPAAAVPMPAAGSGYLLQVGAFPDPAAAESQKAKLAMQGFVANVQTVSINGQAYHRVRLGPFRSATELESTKQRLAGAGFNAIALKEGK